MKGRNSVDTVIIGEVLKPQGIKGELKVYPLTDNLNGLKNSKGFIYPMEKSNNSFEVGPCVSIPKICFFNASGNRNA
jgi:16S rRNA processing protein RimM